MNDTTKKTRTEPEAETKDTTGKLTIGLYLLFFCVWSAGYAYGILEQETTYLFGLPIWFAISCLFSFILVCLALYAGTRRLL